MKPLVTTVYTQLSEGLLLLIRHLCLFCLIMPAVVSDPSSLTTQKLKQELTRFGVALPSSNSKKAVYVELYRHHISNRSEFSSDDDDASETQRMKKKRSSKKIEEPEPEQDFDLEADTAMVNVASLSDGELADMLKEFGVDVGPITETTRGVYERKLERELSSGDATSSRVYEEELEEDYNDYSADDTVPIDDLDPYGSQSKWSQEEEEEVNVRYRPPQDPSSRRTDYAPAARDYASSRTSSATTSYSRTTTSSSSRQSSAAAAAAAATQSTKQEKKKSSGFSICIQLVILAIVAFIIFLVISNMEPGRQKIDVIDTDNLQGENP